MMLALLAPLLASLDRDDPYLPGLLLGVAAAANLGGMGSLIGTPPNAIAVGALAQFDKEITFLEWMLVGLPPALLLLAAAWLLIGRLYPSRRERLPVAALQAGPDPEADDVPRWQRLVVGGTLLLTVGLWLTSQWHGIPTAAVSFIPIVFLTTTGVLGAKAIRGLSWDVLFLLAGGLALGQTVTETGLSTWIVGQLPVEGLGVFSLAAAMALLTVVLSNFMSNTAAANILIPIGVTMAVGNEAWVALPIALAASCAMCLPIATPPGALAFATGRIQTRDFIRIGLVLGVLGPAVSLLWVALIALWVSG
jgi:sodium-dependent dicarboxylate transporter 2/3/5